MLANEVKEEVVDFYKFLHQKGFDTENIILIGSAALVLHGIEDYAADIDMLVPRRKKFVELQNLFNKKNCPISYDKNGVKYQIGLPHDFPSLLRPYDKKEIVKTGDISINVRPLHLIARDYEDYIKKLEEAAKRINEPISALNDFLPYTKYKKRLEKLRVVLYEGNLIPRH
jgi:hypothetical protein